MYWLSVRMAIGRLGLVNKSETEIWIAEQVPKKSEKKPVSLASACQ